ncbi:MAG: polyphosphate polymerase domain-containing protein [Verrucomicrobiae bacterium]|nr:polyphosphate polymerase domain-containing protein [Verrucomicrobiae bacterium]MDW7979917.1 polyphosphate polymerase domain-containing protein [Verrucomicrobiales bacterium]
MSRKRNNQMWRDQVQTQRFERKYLVTESQALVAREFIRAYLRPDVHGSAGPDGHSYPVHSLYLDSPDLLTYWAWVCCEKKRFKLRVRYYSADPDAPLFFEIKRRVNECILKQRALVRRSALSALLAGQPPAPEHLVGDGSERLATLQIFCDVMRRIGAQPVVHVAYLREAWVSELGNSVRVTFDRFVSAEPKHVPELSMRMPSVVRPFGENIVLEVKFTDRFPEWVRDIVQQLDLVACGVPKYCTCVGALMGDKAGGCAPAGLKERLAELGALWQETC